MKRINLLILTLTCSLFILIGVAGNQRTSAFQGDSMGCSVLSNCTGSASCGSSGSAYGCNIVCSSGASVICPPKGGDGDIPFGGDGW